MSNHMKDWESMNAQSSMTPSARTMQTYRKLKWKEINWKQAELYVNRLQVRIVKAVQADKWRLVKRLQKLITNSFYAKALAVKRVITNKGKNTPGIDGDIWSTDEDKIQAVHNLTTSSYKAKPLKRTYIEKYGKKEKRPLGIPTMTDRAMQGLQLLALAPIAETTADKVSFGFRQNRCAQDAMEYMFKLLSRKTSPEWILEGDIKGCFDNISHDWMLENIPSDKRIMRQFLKCGYVENKRLFPTTGGSPQGGLRFVTRYRRRVKKWEVPLPLLQLIMIHLRRLHRSRISFSRKRMPLSFSAIDINSVESAIKDAQDAGIMVMCYGVHTNTYDVSYTNDNAGAGQLIGEQAAQFINDNYDGKAQVGLLTFYENQECKDRGEAMKKALAENAPDAELVVEDSCVVADKAMTIVENWLQTYPDMKVIMSIGDGGGIGANQAVKAAGKQEGFGIFAVDGTIEALQLMANGDPIKAEVAFGAGWQLGDGIVEVILDSLNNGITEKDQVTPNELVTVDTMEDWLKEWKYEDQIDLSKLSK